MKLNNQKKNIRLKKEKIKIGFLSADLRGEHSITYFLKKFWIIMIKKIFQ